MLQDWRVKSFATVVVTVAVFVGAAGQSRAQPPTASEPRAVPAGVRGAWKWATHESADPHPGGTLAVGSFFHFDDDGTFAHYAFVSTRCEGRAAQTWTYLQGTVSFDAAAGTFSLHPTTGRCRTSDNRSRENNADREMTPQELSRHASTYTWRITSDGAGKPVLLAGPTDEGGRPYARWDGEH